MKSSRVTINLYSQKPLIKIVKYQVRVIIALPIIVKLVIPARITRRTSIYRVSQLSRAASIANEAL